MSVWMTRLLSIVGTAGFLTRRNSYLLWPIYQYLKLSKSCEYFVVKRVDTRCHHGKHHPLLTTDNIFSVPRLLVAIQKVVFVPEDASRQCLRGATVVLGVEIAMRQGVAECVYCYI
jgi:hypothetical protein